jgi:hypothetical protein
MKLLANHQGAFPLGGKTPSTTPKQISPFRQPTPGITPGSRSPVSAMAFPKTDRTGSV